MEKPLQGPHLKTEVFTQAGKRYVLRIFPDNLNVISGLKSHSKKPAKNGDFQIGDYFSQPGRRNEFFAKSKIPHRGKYGADETEKSTLRDKIDAATIGRTRISRCRTDAFKPLLKVIEPRHVVCSIFRLVSSDRSLGSRTTLIVCDQSPSQCGESEAYSTVWLAAYARTTMMDLLKLSALKEGFAFT